MSFLGSALRCAKQGCVCADPRTKQKSRSHVQYHHIVYQPKSRSHCVPDDTQRSRNDCDALQAHYHRGTIQKLAAANLGSDKYEHTRCDVTHEGRRCRPLLNADEFEKPAARSSLNTYVQFDSDMSFVLMIRCSRISIRAQGCVRRESRAGGYRRVFPSLARWGIASAQHWVCERRAQRDVIQEADCASVRVRTTATWRDAQPR
jgi:hypothetical protein